MDATQNIIKRTCLNILIYKKSRQPANMPGTASGLLADYYMANDKPITRTLNNTHKTIVS